VSRFAIIGNAGGGKSTLARVLARQRRLRHVEIDELLWQEGWKLSPADVY
jgi:adenylate kinase family enzyme